MILRVRIFILLLALATATAGVAADFKHDMYVCATLSGQGQVMGSSRVVLPSGLLRSGDRQNFEHLGPSHIRLFSVTRDPQDARTLFVALLDGVLRMRHDGSARRTLTDWRMTEPHVIAFDPNATDHIYIGLPDGIGVSRDRGQSWQRANEGIRRSYTHALTIDRTQAGRVLVGTELGIYLTEDGARTWRLVLPTSKVTYDIRQSPAVPRAFLAVTSSNGAHWSDDAGRTWRAIAGVPKAHTLHNCDFDRSDARRIVIGGWGCGVLTSEDGGNTWSDRSAGLPGREINRVSTDPDIPSRIYAAPHLAPLHVSDDFGRTWRSIAFEKAIVYDIVFLARN
jgi:hypothetical protein